MNNPDNYAWYQCDIVKKDGKTDYWCRFIAKSQEDAEQRVISMLRNALTGNIKNWSYQKLAKRYIDDFNVYPVQESVLQKYNFLRQEDCEDFHIRTRG